MISPPRWSTSYGRGRGGPSPTGLRAVPTAIPNPQIGDITTNRWPQHYVTLARVLKPIQVKVHGAFHRGDPTGIQQRMDHEASLAWLFRFDGK